MNARIATALAAVALAACSGGRSPSQATPPAPAPAGAAAAGLSPETAYVTAPTYLRREPTDAARVRGQTPKSSVSNWIAMLQRGERVTVVEARDEWTQVKASDETAGWVKRGLLLPAQGVSEATLLAPADAFDRPDLLAVNARRKIEPGSLVLVVRSRELFSEVNTSSGANAWVLTDRLSTVPRNVMAAKLVEKARWLVRAGKADEAKGVLELARKEFSDVPLVEILARELGEAPDAGIPADVAPVGGPAGFPASAAPPTH